MRTVYGIQFQVQPREGQSPSDCIVQLRDLAAQWVSTKYRQAWKTEAVPQFDGVALEPLPGHWVRTSHQCQDECELVSMEWDHPHDRDDSVVWVTGCTFARQARDVYAAVTIRISSTRFTIRPTRFDLGRPRLVWDALTSFDCTIGGQPVPVGHRELRAAEVSGFADDVVLSGRRALPIIMVSPDSWTEHPIVNAAALQNAVAGFAEVVKLADKWAAFKLTDKIGKELSCFNGAVRVYWPGLTLSDRPYQHPLYLANSIKYHRNHGRELKSHLFRVFAGMSAFRAGELGPIRAVRRTIEAQRDGQLTRLREQVASGEVENSELLASLEDAWNENEQLKAERDRLAEQVETLGTELEAQKANWATYEEYMERQEGKEEITPDSEAETEEFANVLEAYERAKQDFGDNLVFLESADRSAADTPFKSPRRVYEALEALSQVAMEWKENDGRLGRSFKDAMAQLGFDVHGVSDTSKGKWGDDYKFIYEGERRLFEDHVTLGAGQPDTCLSIHWYRDDENLAVVIGHCGIHGTNTSS
ncbi:MAG: hypothetical protein ACLFVU_14250 [Phycisphaerae bacterium]